MMGQKMLYSFFSLSPARKRRACSPEPVDWGTGVPAVAEESEDAAASRTKKAQAGQEELGMPPLSPISPE